MRHFSARPDLPELLEILPNSLQQLGTVRKLDRVLHLLHQTPLMPGVRSQGPTSWLENRSGRRQKDCLKWIRNASTQPRAQTERSNYLANMRWGAPTPPVSLPQAFLLRGRTVLANWQHRALP